MYSTVDVARPGAPERSHQQRLDALQHANRIRLRRAELKRDLKAGRESVRDVLLEPPAWAEGMKVSALLVAVPGLGPTKVAKVLNGLRISPSKSVGGMTERQRRELLSALGARRA